METLLQLHLGELRTQKRFIARRSQFADNYNEDEREATQQIAERQRRDKSGSVYVRSRRSMEIIAAQKRGQYAASWEQQLDGVDSDEEDFFECSRHEEQLLLDEEEEGDDKEEEFMECLRHEERLLLDEEEEGNTNEYQFMPGLLVDDEEDEDDDNEEHNDSTEEEDDGDEDEEDSLNYLRENEHDPTHDEFFDGEDRELQWLEYIAAAEHAMGQNTIGVQEMMDSRVGPDTRRSYNDDNFKFFLWCKLHKPTWTTLYGREQVTDILESVEGLPTRKGKKLVKRRFKLLMKEAKDHPIFNVGTITAQEFMEYVQQLRHHVTNKQLGKSAYGNKRSTLNDLLIPLAFTAKSGISLSLCARVIRSIQGILPHRDSRG